MNDPIALPTALNNVRTWKTGGDVRWFGQKAVTHDGVDAARPDTLGDNQSSRLKTTVIGPAKISFWWKTSSEPGDKLNFHVDTELKGYRF